MEKRLSFDKRCWNNWTWTCKKMNLDTSFISFTKINSNWITDLNTKTHKTLKLLEDNIEENILGLDFSDEILVEYQKQGPWKKKNKLDFIKIINIKIHG